MWIIHEPEPETGLRATRESLERVRDQLIPKGAVTDLTHTTVRLLTTNKGKQDE